MRVWRCPAPMTARSLPDHEAHRDNQSASRGYGDLCAGICNGGDRADAKPLGGKERPTKSALPPGALVGSEQIGFSCSAHDRAKRRLVSLTSATERGCNDVEIVRRGKSQTR